MTVVDAGQSVAVFAWLDSGSGNVPSVVAIADGRKIRPADAFEELFDDGVRGARRCLPWLVRAPADDAICAYAAILGGRRPASCSAADGERGRVHSGFVLDPAPGDRARLGRDLRALVSGVAGRTASEVLDMLRAPAAPSGLAAVDVLRGCVRSGDTDLWLPDGEFGVIATLAMSPQKRRAGELCDMLWPDRDFKAAYNLLKVYFHRLRGRLGAADVIEAAAGRYGLGDRVHVDLNDIEVILRRHRARNHVDAGDMLRLQQAYADFTAGGYRRLAHLEQYGAIERRITALGTTIAEIIVRDAAERNDHEHALRIAEQLLDVDPCAEVGIEHAVRAQLALGQRDAAVRRFRNYRQTLFEDLGAAPSPHLVSMLGLC